MKKLFSLLAVALATQMVVACQTPAESNQPSNNLGKANKQQQTNLIGSFQINKDNLKNTLRGQIYPIAFYINGKYVDVSNDVTLRVKNNFIEDSLLRNEGQKSFLSAIKNFTIVSDEGNIGNFTVDKLAVTRFACSSAIVGTGEQSLSEIFNRIPSDQSENVTRDFDGNKIDQTRKSAVAIANYYPSATKPQPLAMDSSAADLSRYKQDLLEKAKTIISQSPKVQNVKVSSEMVVEKVSVFDLDNDGKVEVFGIVTKGVDLRKPPTTPGEPPPNVYANVWLTYNGEAQVINSEVKVNTLGDSTYPYELLGVFDVNGDGIKEAIARNIDYESITFSIYEYQNQQLNQVFVGAGYGC